MRSLSVPTVHRACMLNCMPRHLYIGRKGVARLMRAAGLPGMSQRRGPTSTTRKPKVASSIWSNGSLQRAVRTRSGKEISPMCLRTRAFSTSPLPLMFSCLRIVGWAMAPHLRTKLVLATLAMALEAFLRLANTTTVATTS